MKEQKLAAINDQTSPLFRIMAVHNDNEPNRRQFDNNVFAFHIGNGYLLSVAHALKVELTLFRSMPEDLRLPTSHRAGYLMRRKLKD